MLLSRTIAIQLVIVMMLIANSVISVLMGQEKTSLIPKLMARMTLVPAVLHVPWTRCAVDLSSMRMENMALIATMSLLD